MHAIPAFCRRALSILLAGAAAATATPPPMEPASRTLFVFVHGINPRSVGAIENVHWSQNVQACTDPSRAKPMKCLPEAFCVPRSELLGKGTGVWVTNIENDASDKSLFCTLKGDLFQRNYSLRSFTDPGASPVDLAHEVGDRDWSMSVGGLTLRPHVLEAMRRHLEDRRDKARARGAGLSGFEADLLRMHPTGPIESFRGIVEAWPDSVPSRLVVLAHSMGGMSTREYLMSDFYKGDLDKVITFDTPHAGSWVAHYNKQGVNALGSPLMEEGTKIALGLSLLGWHETWADKLGTFFLVSGGATTVTSLATGLAGFVGNEFKGDEEANSYLTPGFPALEAMNARNVIGCEKDGCRVPSFVLHTMDGILAPADPGGLVGTGTLGSILPLEALDAANAMLKAWSREWPGALAGHDVLGNAITAGAFAFGGWNYTNHGSLPVPRFSSSAAGIPFLQRTDVVLRRRLSLWDPVAASSAASLAGYAAAWGEASKGAYYSWRALEALSTAGRGSPGMWWPCVGAKIGIGMGIGALISGDMAVYAAFAAASHNASVHETMKRKMAGTVRRADGSTDTLGFQEVQFDLHEAPFAQVASVLHVGPKGDSIFELRIDTGSTGTPKGLEIPVGNMLPIHYPDPFWEMRWAVRHERHDPAGGGTRVRQVRRWNLPVEILTTSQPRSIDFQIDDLHPDRMEQMEVVLNYGLHRFVWDRESGNDTYTLTYFENGQAWTPTTGLPNPIDALGRWKVPLRELIPSKYQVLLDGQNLMGISLVNGVGRHSAQRQFLTFQAAAPSLAMRFPQPWGVVSDPAGMVRFRADLLHYPGIRFDTAEAGWALVPRDSTGMSRPIEPEAWNPLTGLLASDSIQDLELPMLEGWRTPADGPWDLALRIPALQPASGQFGQPGARRFPLWLDRSAPEFRLDAESRRAGEPWRFRLHWTDLPDGLADVVQLVRMRVVDRSGAVVAELPPVEQASVSGVMVSWDGRVDNRQVPDGLYRLEVEGLDGAVADAATMEVSTGLRRRLQQAILEGGDPWTPENNAAWTRLRNDRRLNWGTARREFLVDRTAPVVVPETLPTAQIGRDGRFRLPCGVSDPGGSGIGIRMRFEFRDAATGAAFAQVRELPQVSVSAQQPTAWIFQEGSDAQATLPDGNWQVRVLFEDADGNRDSVEILGRLRIDRTLPSIAQLRASPSYLSSRATESVGPAVVDAGDARTVSGRWVSPDGVVVGAIAGRDATGLWTLSYPESIRRARGTWTLEVVATDSAGNAVRRSTFVQVDLVPPRLQAPSLVDGAVVLTGLAMDPDLDAHAFSSYELSWRPAGTQVWRHDGMRVPGGRGSRTEAWRSLVPQSGEGVLGFWDPPQDASGEVELRVRVDDGTESVHEAVVSSYATSRAPAPFEVAVHLPDTLRAGIGQQVGWSVRGRSEATPKAMVVLVDSASAPLLAVQRDNIEASVGNGRPASLTDGSLHLWREDSKWTFQASGACRGLDVLVQTRSSVATGVVCPTGWTCTEDTMPRVKLELLEGGNLEVDRLLRWRIPAGSHERLEWTPSAVSRVTVIADSIGRDCASRNGCPDGGTVPVRPLPAPGEVRIGEASKPVCDGMATMALRTGRDRTDATWDGFRTDGNWPSSGKAFLEVDLWDPASMRVVHAARQAPVRPGDLAVGAKALGAVVRDGDAPGAQKSAALEYTVEGRAAKVGLSIRSGDREVRRLLGDGTWKEGRSARRPWTVEWDGTDNLGTLVPSGRYQFVVEADGKVAQADVEVGGQAWRTDSTLRLSFAPTEARWSPGLAAWQLMPPAEVIVGTGVKAQSVGQEFSYQMRYEGTQDVVAFRTHRPSLMVRRKRDRVKFGLLWKVTTIQYGYDSDESIGGCGDRSGTEFRDVPVARYLDGGVVDLGRGETIRRELQIPVQTNVGQTTWRMGQSGHKVEWVAVPLSEYQDIHVAGPTDVAWIKALSNRFATGSFRVDDLVVTPTHGLKDVGPAVLQGTWLSEPPPPRTCRDSILARTDLDGVLDSRDWTRKHCPEVPDNEEVVNPNRNLLQMRVATNHTSSLPLSGLGMPVFVWANGDAGANCADSKLNNFSFAADIRVPDRFFDAEPGIDNLANRLLRFDASNRFLYGVGAYLSQDGIDNDGNGRSDDGAESQGTISPFEKRAYEWRPLHSDLESQFFDCSGYRSIAVPEYCEENYEGTYSCRPGEAPGTGWTPVGEPGACDPYGIAICQTWRGWEQKTCQRTVLQASDTRGNILEDKLNFFEGDHSPDGDLLEMWFTNTPEEGVARFLAKVGQGDRSWTLDSRTHQGREKALTIPLSRLSLSSVEAGGEIRRQFEPRPVRITVGVDDDLVDATSSSGALASFPWPLDEPSWKRAKEVFEAPCQSVDPVDPSACRRVHLAASGVRLGLDDGLAPSQGGIAYRSTAQQQFFRDRAAGRAANPDGLPMGRIPSGSGLKTLSGVLTSDALGRAVHVDSLHRGLPRPDADLGATLRRATAVGQEGVLVEGPDTRGDYRWIGLAQPVWSLVSDPRLRPRDRLQGVRSWKAGQDEDRVGLLELYRATARPFPDGNPGVPLYVGATTTTHAPNTAALAQVRLDSIAVLWRDGSEASSRFTGVALEADATGYPGGVLVRRQGRAEGMPEWVGVRGAVPAGRTYQLGWSAPTGGWRPVTAERVSDCPVSESAVGRCPLGFVDVARLPEKGHLLLRVRHEGDVAFQSLPFVRGTVLPDTGTSTVRSVFGDAEVVFPSGALVNKPDSLRAVSVRLLSPAEAGIPPEAGVALTGPVVEILPSQAFGAGSSPEIVLRLPREVFTTQGYDPSLVRLFRVDVAAGQTTLLEDQVVRYFQDGQPIAGDGAWTVAEFHARTASFSSFALLPVSTPDSRLWSVSVAPLKGTARERALETRGVLPEQLEFHWDDDPVFLDPSDPTPPVGFRPSLGDEGARIELPERSRSWLSVRRRDGGLPRTLALEWIRDDFHFASRSSDTIVAGVLDGRLRIPYVSSHTGALRLLVQGASGPSAWVADTLHAGEGLWTLPVPVSWSHLGPVLSTRLVATDEAGRVREVQGPVVVLDAVRPVCGLSGSVRKTSVGWSVQLLPRMHDSEGAIVSSRIELRLQDGTIVGSWEGGAPVETDLSALHTGAHLRADLLVEDGGGNRASASWEGVVAGPETEAALWLVPQGDATRGWSVTDLGRHGLDVHAGGVPRWIDGSVALQGDSSLLVTDSVALRTDEATFEVFGAWTSGQILLGRRGAWMLRRQGADVILEAEGATALWKNVFRAAVEWRHLVVVQRQDRVLLVVDGKEHQTRMLPLLEERGERRSWYLGAGGEGARFALARVWTEALDQKRIDRLRAEATGLDSVLWQEAEWMAGGAAAAWLDCQLPSRQAVVAPVGGTRVVLDLQGPRKATIAGRWRSGRPLAVAVSVDGVAWRRVQLPARESWGSLSTWTGEQGVATVDLAAGPHRLAFDLPEGLELDGLALVSGSGDPSRWIPETDSVEPVVEVLARDESPTDQVHFRPRIVVRNLRTAPLSGYRLHVQVRSERGRVVVADTWWPAPLSTTLRPGQEGLYTWRLDRPGVVLAAGQRDFDGVGAAVGFHHDDWSSWSRTNDPVWGESWKTGAWIPGTTVAVTSLSGRLLAPMSCRDEAPPPWAPLPRSLTLDGSGPKVFEGREVLVEVDPTGDWGWSSTVLGFSPLDGRALEGVLEVDGVPTPLAGWWQSMSLPNAGHTRKVLRLTFPDTRRVQIQKWEQ